MRASKHPCPDCGAKVRKISQRWTCLRCAARGTFLGRELVVTMRHLSFSQPGGGWRLNPFHPDAPRFARLRAKVVGQ